LILIERRHRRDRHVKFAADAERDLPAQDHAPLLLDEAAFGKAGLSDDLDEARTIELAVEPAETGVVGNAAGDLVVADAEPQRLRLLVERGLGHQLAEHLAVDAGRARLVGRDRAANLAAELLQALGVILAELFDRDLGVADLERRIEPEAAENIADAPDREADDQAAHDDAHHGLADPGRSGFVDTAEHGLRSSRTTVTAEWMAGRALIGSGSTPCNSRRIGLWPGRSGAREAGLITARG
jgi:hypothetical protein